MLATCSAKQLAVRHSAGLTGPITSAHAVVGQDASCPSCGTCRPASHIPRGVGNDTAGMSNVLLTPLSLQSVKRLQGLMRTLRTAQVLSAHGVRGLYRGMAAPLSAVSAYNAIVFTTNSVLGRLLAHTDGGGTGLDWNPVSSIENTQMALNRGLSGLRRQSTHRCGSASCGRRCGCVCVVPGLPHGAAQMPVAVQTGRPARRTVRPNASAVSRRLQGAYCGAGKAQNHCCALCASCLL